MTENHFLSTPPVLYLYDPFQQQCTHAWVFVGDVPAKVGTKIASLGNGAPISDTAQTVLRDYYGPSWKSRLLLCPFKYDVVQRMKAAIVESSASSSVVGGSEGVSAGGSEGVSAGGSERSINHEYSIKGGATTDNIQLDEISRILKTDVVDMSFTENEMGVNLRRKIATKTSPPVSHPHGKVTYPADISVYPEDNLMEFKEKVFLATGIPLYRQHLFYITNRVRTTYTLMAESATECDITSLPTDTIAGVPYDATLAAAGATIHVESREVFTIMDHVGTGTFFVVDAAIFTYHNQTQLAKIARDTYSLDMIYYGWVMKYFPMMATRECFIDFITSESDIFSKFPTMARPKTTLGYLYKAERAIINDMYRAGARVEAQRAQTHIAITNMTLSVMNQKCIIDVRNLFDKLRTSSHIPEIHAYVEYDGGRWLLRKKYMRSGDIVFPSSVQFKTGVIMAIAVKSDVVKHMFLNIHPNGKYWVKVVWREEEGVDFAENLRLVKKYVDGVLKSVNSLGRTVFIVGKDMPLPTQDNIIYSGMNISLMWKRVFPEHSYKVLKTLLDPYMRAGLILPRNVQQFDKYEFLWHKGMYEFDQTLLERIVVASGEQNFNNTYNYMTSNLVKQKWEQHYSGRIVRMLHRTTDIKFEVLDVHQEEFDIFHRYMLGFIHNVSGNPALHTARHEPVKKLSKLMQEDPELYKLRIHDESSKVYSILCQNTRQPFIYTPDEIAAMSPAAVSRLEKYWNFTTRTPAYYKCPSEQYPHMSFITGMHPKGYCLPCCKRKPDSASSLKRDIKLACMTEHKYIDGPSRGQRHIMSYGKTIDVDRLSRVPHTVSKLLFTANLHSEESVPGGSMGESKNTGNAKLGGVKYKKNTTRGYYILGVQQTVPAEPHSHGIVFALAKALSMTISEFITDVTAKLSTREELLFTLARGTIIQYVDSMAQLVDMLRGVYLYNSLIDSRRIFTDFTDLFMELAPLLYGIHCICFIDHARAVDTEQIDMYVNDITRQYIENISGSDATAVFLQRTGDVINPIFYVNIDHYYTTGEIITRLFPIEHPFVQLAITALTLTDEQVAPKLSHVVKMALMTNSNRCCGVVVEVGGQSAYVPLDYTWIDGVPMTYTPSDIFTRVLHLEVMLEVSRELGYEVEYYIKYEGKWIGVRFTNGLTGYFNSGNVPEGVPWFEPSCHPLEVADAVAGGKAPIRDARVVGHQLAMYNAYSYQLLLVEFINFLETDRNRQLRAKIYEIIMRSRGDFYPKIKALLEAEIKVSSQRDTDLKTLHDQISEYTFGHYSKHYLIAELEHNVYEFDKITINRLRTMSPTDVRAEVSKIVRSITTQGELSDGIFPNIYIPCGGDRGGSVSTSSSTDHHISSVDDISPTVGPSGMSSSASISALAKKNFVYCRGAKLILNDPDDYIDILVADFTSPIKLRYLLNSLFADSAAEYFKFIQSPMEDINVYKL